MFGSLSSRSARTPQKVCERLTKRHGRALEPGEHFVAACDGFAPDAPHPQAAGAIRAWGEHVELEQEALLRLFAVQTTLGIEDATFTELPISPSGYLVAHTQSRLFIFDGKGEEYITEADVSKMWLQPIEHDENMFTLVFRDGDECVAVATRRQSADMTRHFIESFPDLRGEARLLVVAGQPAVAEF